mmetsp:Transcript_25589/g.33478  ORF Transcript_25589/g.33478 Transcript_25589/m.33478 type:complete len:432 (+) Transcript_25589:143-1438(+)
MKMMALRMLSKVCWSQRCSSSPFLAKMPARTFNSWDEFCSRSGVTQTAHDHKNLSITWEDGHSSQFPLIWLADNAPEAFDPQTKQRMANRKRLSMTHRIQKIELISKKEQSDDMVLVYWAEGSLRKSLFSARWLRQQCMSSKAKKLRPLMGRGGAKEIALWGKDLLSQGQSSPYIEFAEVVDGGAEGVKKLMTHLSRYGIVFVNGVPTTIAETQRLSETIGPIKNTLYGGMWSTRAASNEEEIFNDTAYGNEALPLHTDGTYFHDPPGLQVFNCTKQGYEGGASRFADGFAVAERLKEQAPWAFEFLSKASFDYQCFDNNCHLYASGPIFLLNKAGQVIQMRHNDTDQVPLTGFSNEDIELFYNSQKELTKVIEDPDIVFEKVLQPGETFILNNHRVMHGRSAFKGERRMIGCYIGSDDFESHARHLNLWD